MYATLVVAAHAAATSLHGASHVMLGVYQSALANAYIVTVIMVAPLLSAALLWKRRTRRAAEWLFFGSMLGSLIFGVVNHFVFVSPDHVSHLPEGGWRAPFVLTAVLLAAIEFAGTVLGAFMLSGPRASVEDPARRLKNIRPETSE